MTGSRELVLGRIRSALARDDRSPVVVDRSYDRQGSMPPGSAEVVDLLIDRLIDYKALVRRANPDSLPAVIDEALGGMNSVVIPAGLPAADSQASISRLWTSVPAGAFRMPPNRIAAWACNFMPSGGSLS